MGLTLWPHNPLQSIPQCPRIVYVKQILHHLLSFEELQGKAASVPLPEQANDAEVEALHF